jgi:S1-C subfamily serine protease
MFSVKACLVVLAALTLFGCGSNIPDGARFLDSVGPSIVSLTKPSLNTTGGTGFAVVAPSGAVYTLTNAHICALAENNKLMAHKEDGTEILIKVLEVSPEADMCLAEAVPGVPGLLLAHSLKPHQLVIALGHPLLLPLVFNYGYVIGEETVEVADEGDKDCSGPAKHKESVPTFLGVEDICVVSRLATNTSTVIYPGNSGSPMLDSSGDVAGIYFAGSSRTNWGSAVPLRQVKAFLSGR